MWTANPHLPDTSPLPNFQPRPQNQQTQNAAIDDQTLSQHQVKQDVIKMFLPLSTNLPLKNNLKKVYFPMDFGELNTDGLRDTSALSSVILEAHLRKIQVLAPKTILNEGPPPEFQILVVKGKLKKPIASVEL